MSTATTDVVIENYGSLHLFQPLTTQAHKWLEANTNGYWISGALAVEPRFAMYLAQGLQDNGFTVE